jgi:hypothetical protein
MVLKNLEDAIHARWPEAVVRPFGSFPSKLSTFLSDIDITILGLTEEEVDELQQTTPEPSPTTPSRTKRRLEESSSPCPSRPLSPSPSSGHSTQSSMKRQKPNTDPTERSCELKAVKALEGEEEEEVEVSWFIDRGTAQEASTKSSTAPQTIIDLITPPGSSLGSDQETDEDDGELIRPFPPDMPVFVFTDSSFGEESEDNDDDDESDESEEMSELDDDDLILTNNNGDLDIHINCSPSSMTTTSVTATGSSTPRLSLLSHKSLPRGHDTRQQEQQILYALSHYLRSLDYIRALEFRSHARVPIINLIHKGDIECDISIGLSQQKTNNLIQLLSYQHTPPSSASASSTLPLCRSPSPATSRSLALSRQVNPMTTASPKSGVSHPCSRIFHEISSFLKVFFHQFSLDLPYTGGLGSYKLYGMITFIINLIRHEHLLQSRRSHTHRGHRQGQQEEDEDGKADTEDLTLDSGYILIFFFKYFGNKSHLNLGTVLRIKNQNTSSRGGRGEGEGEEEDILVDFSKTTQVTFCQRLCSRAYCVLSLIITQGLQHISTLSSSTTSKHRHSSHINTATTTTVTEATEIKHHSTLSVLISRCDEFIQSRILSSKLCRIECPLLLDCDKDNMGKIILEEMKAHLNTAIDRQITCEDIRRYNPQLWERMRCYGRIPSLRGGGGSNGDSTNRGSRGMMNGGGGRGGGSGVRNGYSDKRRSSFPPPPLSPLPPSLASLERKKQPKRKYANKRNEQQTRLVEARLHELNGGSSSGPKRKYAKREDQTLLIEARLSDLHDRQKKGRKEKTKNKRSADAPSRPLLKKKASNKKKNSSRRKTI